MALHIPIAEQRFDQFDEDLRLVRLDINDHVDVLFHVRPDVADRSSGINRIYAFNRDVG